MPEQALVLFDAGSELEGYATEVALTALGCWQLDFAPPLRHFVARRMIRCVCA